MNSTHICLEIHFQMRFYAQVHSRRSLLSLARIIVQMLCTVLFLCVCVMFFHLPMSFEISRCIRIWPLRQCMSAWYLNHVIVNCAVRRSRSGLLRAGVTVPNQSQIQDCQSKSQHGPRISCLPSHDKCICCCPGIWITRASSRY